MAFDGEIRFNTRINNSNVQKDLNKVEGEIRKSQNSIVSDIDKSVKRVSGKLGGLTSVVQKLGAAIASVFAVQQIAMFVKDFSQAAMNLSNALTGLQSILEGQGRSFSEAKSFIEEYTKDGLIPATNAITAYKNLASRGYDDSQIRQVMTALKDASAYGRQASMTMGDAVQSATEGLKNENSILVDNAGVTKNVAKMWEEYAASIGTIADNLTQQQKIQAEVNGILEETKFQAGDAAKVAGTLSGQLQQLSFNFNNLKIAIGNVINPIVQTFLPTINAAIQVMTQFANAVASVVGALFGKASVQASTLASANESIAATASAGAAAEKELADATTAAGKAAKKSLSSFDEINKLQDSTGSGGGSASGSVGGGGLSSTSNTTADTEVEDTISPKIQAIVDKIKGMVEPLKEIDFSTLRTSLSELGEAFSEFGSTVGDSLEWAWFHILVPLSQFSIEKGGPKSVDLLTSAFKFLQSVLEPVITGLGNLLEALEPVFTFVGDTAVKILDWFSDAFEGLTAVFEENGPEIEGIFSNIGEVFAVVWNEIEPLIEDMVDVFGDAFAWIMEIVEDAADFVIGALYGVTEFLAGVFTGDWERAWDGIGKIFEETGDFLVDIADWILSAFGLSFEDIAETVEGVWNNISEFTSDIWEGIWKAIKGIINGIIACINGMVGGIASGINAVVRALNKFSFTIPEWLKNVPGASSFAGKKFGFNLSTVSAPKIPYLAQGAVLPANKPFLAMVGDQKNGTNVEAPLETIKQALAEVMAMQGTGDININFTGDLAALARVLKPAIDRESNRAGGSLATFSGQS